MLNQSNYSTVDMRSFFDDYLFDKTISHGVIFNIVTAACFEMYNMTVDYQRPFFGCMHMKVLLDNMEPPKCGGTVKELLKTRFIYSASTKGELKEVETLVDKMMIKTKVCNVLTYDQCDNLFGSDTEIRALVDEITERVDDVLKKTHEAKRTEVMKIAKIKAKPKQNTRRRL